jgi:diamine N-acetyltransferase
MNFRQAQPTDVYQLAQISCTTFIDTYATQNDATNFYAYVEKAFSVEQLEKELYTEGSLFYFLENEGDTIGYFKINTNLLPTHSDRPEFDLDFSPFANTPMTELERIYLKTEYHGKGLAATMMSYIESVAEQHGSAYLWLGVWVLNPKAIRFYEKCGFSRFGTHIFQIGNDAQEDWLMWKKLERG